MKGRIAVHAGLALFFLSFFLPGPAQSAGAECEPSIGVEPMSAGQARLALSVPCMPGQKVRFRYAGLELVRKTDESGKLTIIFDCFLGDNTPLTVAVAGAPEIAVELRTLDLDRVTMMAISWKGSVNLD